MNPYITEALLVNRERNYQTIGLSTFDNPIKFQKCLKHLGVHTYQHLTESKHSEIKKENPSRQCGLACWPLETDGACAYPIFLHIHAVIVYWEATN